MDNIINSKSNNKLGLKHIEWRKLVKKMQRKRKRQHLAKERDKAVEIENAKKLNDPVYQAWLKEQNALEICRQETLEHFHEQQEEQWMRRELLAQISFKQAQNLQLEKDAIKEAQRLQIQQEFEQLQNKAKQQKIIKQQQIHYHQKLLLEIKKYINGDTEVPVELQQTANLNPGKELCIFFVKTATCRFGDKCSRNHCRPGLSRIILVRNFFSHIRLEQSQNTEYGADFGLEYTDSDLYQDYYNFYNDVISEMESFGKILNFKVCNNCQPHLRGNAYIEFSSNREALKALMQLQGRYYAGKQINVEFCSLISWRSAVCGENYLRKCPKGKYCNFLHVFKNPDNKYCSWFTTTDNFSSTNADETNKSCSKDISSWDNIDDQNSGELRNCRWSESPEKLTDVTQIHKEERKSFAKSYERHVTQLRKTKSKRRLEIPTNNYSAQEKSPNKCRHESARSQFKKKKKKKSHKKDKTNKDFKKSKNKKSEKK